MTRLSTYFLPTLREDPADAESVSHRLMVRAGLDPPARRRAVDLAAGRLPGGHAGRGDHPRGDRRDRRPGDADAGAAARRALAARPAATRSTSCSSSRTARTPTYVLAMTHEEALTFHVAREHPLLPRAAEDPLPRPGQGARRAAPARRGAAHARVHDEGLLLASTATTRASTRATSSTAAPTTRILDRCGLRWYEVESDVGMMGGTGAHEYMAPCAAGENEVALAPGLRRQRRGRLGRAAAGRAAAARSTSRARCRPRA